MRPEHQNEYREEQIIIDSSLDHSIVPPEVQRGYDVLAPGVYNQYSFDDGYVDFSEIDSYEHREHFK